MSKDTATRESSSGTPASGLQVIAAEKAAREARKRLIYILLGLGMFTAVLFSPAWPAAVDPAGKVFELTWEGKAAMALFLLAATWWVTEVVPIGVTSIAIATTDLAHRAELAAAHLGIGKYIDMIIGADSVPEAKPAPAMLNRICGRFGISPGAAVMVGDADTDIRMGLNAGFKASIAVATGLTEDEILRELTPYRVGSIADIAIRD